MRGMMIDQHTLIRTLKVRFRGLGFISSLELAQLNSVFQNSLISLFGQIELGTLYSHLQ